MNQLEDLIILSNKTIQDALVLLDKNARGILFVTENRKLVGVATDGDIRRALIRKISLTDSIKEAMNLDFVSLPIDSHPSDIRKAFSSRLRIIPLCNNAGELVDIADAQRTHRIPLVEPDLSGRELEYVTNCIQSNWISSQGEYVLRFEKQFEDMHPGTFALAVSNGTVALHLALHALGVKMGDEVIVPNVTFAASINSVIYCNATPVLCEIDSDTFCIDVEAAEKLVTKNTKAIMPVHLYGQPCEMGALVKLAKKHNLIIVEDCAEALGSRWNEKPVGVFGDAATFSFFGNKTISTGEGGMVLLRDKATYMHAKVLRDHGMSREKKYWHEHVGFNYRLTNLQAALGVAQLERFEEIIAKKMAIARSYTDGLMGLEGVSRLPPITANCLNSNWLYTIVLKDHLDRDSIIDRLLSMGVETRPVFHPLSEMAPYRSYAKAQKFPKSANLSKSGLSLPTSVSITKGELEYVISSVKKVLDSNSG